MLRELGIDEASITSGRDRHFQAAMVGGVTGGFLRIFGGFTAI